MHAIITNHNIDIIIRETRSMSSSEAHYVHSVLSHDLPLQSRPIYSTVWVYVANRDINTHLPFNAYLCSPDEVNYYNNIMIIITILYYTYNYVYHSYLEYLL